MNPLNPSPAPRGKSWSGALGFVAGQAVGLLLLQLVLGGVFMLRDQGNAFAGVNLVIALYTAPVLLLLVLPFWLLLYLKSDRPRRLALLVSLLAVIGLQLFLRSSPPAGAAHAPDAPGVAFVEMAHV